MLSVEDKQISPVMDIQRFLEKYSRGSQKWEPASIACNDMQDDLSSSFNFFNLCPYRKWHYLHMMHAKNKRGFGNKLNEIGK